MQSAAKIDIQIQARDYCSYCKVAAVLGTGSAIFSARALARPKKFERRIAALEGSRSALGCDQWKKVWSMWVIPTRVIVEPSGRVIVVLPPLTLAVATTWSTVAASWPAKVIPSP